MIRKYPVESQKINWKHVADDQWACTVTGVAEGFGEFRFPSKGVFVVVGQDQIRKFTENWASNRNVIALFGKD